MIVLKRGSGNEKEAEQQEVGDVGPDGGKRSEKGKRQSKGDGALRCKKMGGKESPQVGGP